VPGASFNWKKPATQPSPLRYQGRALDSAMQRLSDDAPDRRRRWWLSLLLLLALAGGAALMFMWRSSDTSERFCSYKTLSQLKARLRVQSSDATAVHAELKAWERRCKVEDTQQGAHDRQVAKEVAKQAERADCSRYSTAFAPVVELEARLLTQVSIGDVTRRAADKQLSILRGAIQKRCGFSRARRKDEL